jgi:diguanylate cyclase (GGDEF)-like protein/PAS domain S-box-containing protein
LINILLIEDNPGDIDLINEMVMDHVGFDLISADRLSNGLACLKQHDISLILLDLSLPDSAGMGTFSKLHKIVPEIPIVVLTGTHDEDIGLTAVSAGAQDYLIKGRVDSQLLFRTISYAIERKRFERALGESEEKLRSVVEAVREVIFHIDQQGNITLLNAAWKRILGHQIETSIGKPLHEFIHHKDKQHSQQLFDRLLRHEHDSFRFEARFSKDNETRIWMEVDIVPNFDDRGNVIGVAGTLSDISERKKNEERLVYMATHDDLTGLPNRNMFEDRLNQAMGQASRSGKMVGVLFLDLDQFKMVNDSIGHDQGDILLQIIASKLQETVRAIDTVARLGGDEFVIVLSDLDNDLQAMVIANKIMKLFEHPVFLKGQEFYVGGSIGIAIFPRDGEYITQLLSNADAAMYKSKELGRKQICFYSPEMNDKILGQLTLENDLRRAIKKNEFEVYYQPKLSLASGKIVGFEALLRWHDPMKRCLKTNELITMAETSDLILDIGSWVLRTACNELVGWQKLGYTDVTMAVNLSLRQFWQNNLAQSILDILLETGMDSDKLELEITESHVMRNSDETIDTLRKLNGMGITLSIDDFGTGYSSLSYLKRLPIHALKIDQIFVRDITGDQDAAAITQSIIALAHTMNLHVIAEGVETESQHKLLDLWHCDLMQGYLFSEPLPSVAALNMLRQQSSRPTELIKH